MKNLVKIREFLTKNFDLSEKEVKIYLFLVKNGGATVLETSEATQIKRPTVHVNLETLARKKLIKQIHKGQGSRRILFAEPPEKLSLLLEQRKKELLITEKELPNIIKKISMLNADAKSSDLDMRYYVGNEVRFIYDDVLRGKEIRTYANTTEIAKFFPKNINKFIEAHHKRKDMKIWEIMEDTPEARHYLKAMSPDRCFYKLVSDPTFLAMFPSIDYFIYDGKIAMVEVADETVKGILIKNQKFYESSKAIHQFVWSYLPENPII